MGGTVQIGLSGWGDHSLLYPYAGERDKLATYANYFPIVELDSSFYAIQPERNYDKWLAETPEHFGFIIKAYQGLTGHLRGESPFKDIDAAFDAFLLSIQPVLRAGKLKALLFQYPPWFDCTKANVDILRAARQRIGDLPVALEFRHQSWFAEDMRDRTLAFMERERWAHSICDEPQVEPGSVPIVAVPTVEELTIVRFHGRNMTNWAGGGQDNWREVRYLYRYNEQELGEWAQIVRKLLDDTREICIIFNNNSGGDAAANARMMMQLLGQQPAALPPEQLDLF